MTRVDPRQRDPRFPGRPTHPDFIRLSEAIQDNDIAAENNNNVFDVVGVDQESFIYFLTHRLIRMRQLGIDPATETGLMALYADAFAVGAAYQKKGSE